MAKPWITIMPVATAAGVVAGSLTFTVASTSATALAKSTHFTVDTMSDVASRGVRMVWGDVPAVSLRILGRTLADSSESNLQQGGTLTAGALAAVVGGATTLSIVVGGTLLHYTIKYGGNLSREMAIRLSELYLTQPVPPVEGDWVLLEPPKDVLG